MNDKKIEVLPPNDGSTVDITKLVSALEPIAKLHFDNQLELSKEETRRADMQNKAQREVWLARERNQAWDAWREYFVILIALLAFIIAMAFGMFKDNSAIISSAIVGISTFIGGFGLGRTSQSKANTKT